MVAATCRSRGQLACPVWNIQLQRQVCPATANQHWIKRCETGHWPQVALKTAIIQEVYLVYFTSCFLYLCDLSFSPSSLPTCCGCIVGRTFDPIIDMVLLTDNKMLLPLLSLPWVSKILISDFPKPNPSPVPPLWSACPYSTFGLFLCSWLIIFHHQLRLLGASSTLQSLHLYPTPCTHWFVLMSFPPDHLHLLICIWIITLGARKNNLPVFMSFIYKVIFRWVMILLLFVPTV